MQFRDLSPREDPKGGSPKSPLPIPVSQLSDTSAGLDQGSFNFAGGFWPAAMRVITWLLQLAVLAAVVWVKSNFVSREEYQKDSKESLAALNSINISMQRITDKLDGYERISKKEEDLEQRIHEMEKQQWSRTHP